MISILCLRTQVFVLCRIHLIRHRAAWLMFTSCCRFVSLCSATRLALHEREVAVVHWACCAETHTLIISGTTPNALGAVLNLHPTMVWYRSVQYYRSNVQCQCSTGIGNPCVMT